ncbi:MAG: aminotransferase class III-fold pyridoxal phosphate-dependent enzyme [Candidatus Magasanikbacteria bacterium]|nr:aminotransferase class III-fold pyridoxal phosphate-dependent enzyme [Candidatus Magasanikbacteria bacterium]
MLNRADGWSRERIVDAQRDHYFYTWIPQGANPTPIVFDRGEGVYFWDRDGKRYLDFSSQLMNLNVGHGHPAVLRGMRAALDRVWLYASPQYGVEPRAKAAAMLAELTPGDLVKTFFCLGGADAVCNAIKMARLWGRRNGSRFKILVRYDSYHGSVGEADQASGDPRRFPHEPGNPGFVHMHGPYAYRCPFGYAPEGNLGAYIAHVRETIEREGPGTIAAILMEPVTGTSGLIIPPKGYWSAMRQLADEYGFLLIADEVMCGFGRTGKMFATEHDGVVPDILVLAKGLTSGYAPLGAVVVRQHLADFFNDEPLVCGLTYAGHPFCCATAIANMQVYLDEGLVENSRVMGVHMRGYLERMKELHPCVGDVRSIGLFGALELVSNPETREPLSPWNKPLSQWMKAIYAKLGELGIATFVRWNMVYTVPPLIVNAAQLAEGFAAIDEALKLGDEAVG